MESGLFERDCLRTAFAENRIYSSILRRQSGPVAVPSGPFLQGQVSFSEFVSVLLTTGGSTSISLRSRVFFGFVFSPPFVFPLSGADEWDFIGTD